MVVTGRYFWDVAEHLMQHGDAPAAPPAPDAAASHTAPLSVWADADGAEAALWMPGVAPDDLEVTVLGSMVSVVGKASMPAPPEGGRWLCREGVATGFSRTFELPFAAAPDLVKASLSDGILRLRLPRAESSKPRRIALSNEALPAPRAA